MNCGRDRIEEPDIKIFKTLNELDSLKQLSPEGLFKLAICFTEIQRCRVAWPMLETLSLSQKELRRLCKMRRKAYLGMRQWLAVRDLADTMLTLGAAVESGELKLHGSAECGTLKVATLR